MKNLAAILLIAIVFVASTAFPGATTNATPASQSAQESVADFFNGKLPPYAERFVELMIERLNLTDAQRAEIRAILAAERPTVEPLVHQLITAQEELRATIRARGFNETETRAFVARYTGTVTELIVAKERIAARIYAVLTPEQRAQLEEIRAGATASQTGGAVSGNFSGAGNLSSIMSGNFSRIMSGLNLTSLQQLRLLMIVSSESSVIDPLLQRLSETAGQLRTATANGQFNEAQVRALAAQQTDALAALAAAVLRLVSKVYEVLTPEQRAQIEALRDSMELRVRGLFSFFSIDDPRYFVRQHYVDFLGREPEAEGWQAWQNTLKNCPAGDTRCDAVEVSSAFFRSEEFQIKGFFLYRFYTTAFGRRPEFRQFMADLRSINGSTPQEVEAKRVEFMNSFVSRTEFRSLYDGLTNEAYVDRLLQTAGVSLSNRSDLVASLNNNTLTRAQVLRQIVESREVARKEYNGAFVAMQYFGYLRRDPEEKGYQDWLNTINANPNDYRNMVNGFVNSTEYRNRFFNGRR